MEQFELKNQIFCRVLGNELCSIQDINKAKHELLFYINNYYDKEIMTVTSLIKKLIVIIVKIKN